MAKIPFDIKFRPQIESGEYKVETRNGKDVTIVHIDPYGEAPMEVRLDIGGELGVQTILYRSDGTLEKNKESSFDLFLITPEPELSEFEKRLFEIRHIAKRDMYSDEEWQTLRGEAAELLELAIEQIRHKWVIRQESYQDGYINGLHDGKAEASNDLPRWKKATGKERFNERMIVLTGDNDLFCTNYAEEGEYYISFSALEKLPKED